MILKLIIVFCSIIFTHCLHIDHIAIGRQLRLLKSIPEETLVDSMKDVEINLPDIIDFLDFQNLTTECADDLVLIGLALNRSDQVPSDFLKDVAMSKLIRIKLFRRYILSGRCNGPPTFWDVERD